MDASVGRGIGELIWGEQMEGDGMIWGDWMGKQRDEDWVSRWRG